MKKIIQIWIQVCLPSTSFPVTLQPGGDDATISLTQQYLNYKLDTVDQIPQNT